MSTNHRSSGLIMMRLSLALFSGVLFLAFSGIVSSAANLFVIGDIRGLAGFPVDAYQNNSAAVGPDIAVEQPAGTNLVDGVSTVNFGSSPVGTAAPTLTFTIRNTGDA